MATPSVSQSRTQCMAEFVASETRVPFQYELLEALDQFRLLYLLPSYNDSASIECCLFRASIADSPPYEALSYCWGDEKNDQLVFINDHAFYIRLNLHCALKRLRLAESPRILWIDAICIDQENIEERNAQVSQMRHIYANADEVAIWLGEEADGSDIAMDFVPGFIGYLETYIPTMCKNGFDIQFADKVLLIAMYTVSKLFERPWWRRVWILQEVAVSKHATLYCGSMKLNWLFIPRLTALVDVINLLEIFQRRGTTENFNEIGAVLVLLRHSYSWAHILSGAQLGYLEKTKRGLSRHIVATSGFEASDPRDKIFALLGLLQPNSNLRPDYRQSVEQVYTSANLQILQENGDLRSFRWFRGDCEGPGGRKLPSWVFDFRSFSRGSAGDISSFPIPEEGNFRLYSASGIACPTLHVDLKAVIANNTLVLKGIAVDEISQLGNAAPDAVGNSLQIKNGDSVNNYVRKESFWRTVLVDKETFDFEDSRHPTLDTPRRLNRRASFKPPETAQAERETVKLLDIQGGPQFTRRFLITKNGCMGLAPRIARIGDLLCVLLGGEVPFVLRPLEGGYYEMIGECYVHGIMDGEVIKDVETGKYSYQDFALK